MQPALVVLLGCAAAFLYLDVGRGLVVQWATSPDASYGLILAAAAAGMLWIRRQRLAVAGQSRLSATLGLLLLSAGVAAYLAGVFAADLFVARASIVPVAGGLTWFLAGPAAARATVAPLAFLLLAIPLPEVVVNSVTLPLQLAASRLAEETLRAGGIPVFRDGNVLELQSTTLQVVEACAGLRSAISLTTVAVLLVWASGGPARNRAAVIAGAVPIAIVVNGLRVAATGAACEIWGPSAARGAWHQGMGWMSFVMSLALLLALQRVLSGREPVRTRVPAAVRA
jgi:exosortase